MAVQLQLEPITQRYFEDVQVGDELPGYSFELDWTEMVKQVSGSQDFYAVHHDPEFARSGGHADIFYNTGWTQSQLNRLLLDYAGPDGWVSGLSYAMRKMNRPGATISVKGKVVGKEKTAAGNKVELEIWIENDKEGVTTPATGTVLLPSKS